MTIEKKYLNMKMLFVVILALNLLLSIYVAFFKKDAYRLETLKVGGRENMNMAVQLYTSDTYIQQQSATLQQYLASIGATDTTNNTDDVSDTSATQKGDKDTFAAIAQDGYILGNKDARITIIEYSDMLCPYCKRHYNAQTIENLVKKYPNDVNMIFRQMPLAQLHPTAPIGAQGALCVGALAGSDAYYAYLKQAFAMDEFTESNVTAVATDLGVNKSKFTKCLTSDDTLSKVAAQIAEGNSFGINGTPGNLVVDNEKGTYVLIAGAYPAETFEAEIAKILKD